MTSLSGLIEQQVAARPDAVAVHAPGHEGGTASSLTYRELSRAANRLARLLAARGIGSGDRVVTSLRPGPLLVTALLAVLRAGAAYVALDPADPVGHRRRIVSDSAARAVLTENEGTPDYADLGAALLPLDAAAAEISRYDGELPDGVAYSEDDTAYVCYTPGTDATPEGVVVAHRALDALVRSGAPVRPGADDVVAQVAGPASASAAFEIWATLAAGARLVVLSGAAVAGPERLRRALVEHGVTVALLTSARFHRIVRDRPAAFASLRVLLVGGGSCDPHRVRQVLRAGPPRRLLYVYGTAETAAFALCHEITEAPETGGAVPVGRPVGSTAAVVVGADGMPAAPGTVGELLLGGPGLADGYLGRPELTARRFVEDRFTGVGGRLLRTGDKVLLRTDGALEYAGRVDGYVTLHGLRAELHGIESVLTAHPAVSEAVVTVHTDADGERYLVGHVVPDGAAPAADGRALTEGWREIHEALHSAAPAGGPEAAYLPGDELGEWRRATVRRVRELGRRRVLEIGAGSGLLMAELARDEECEEYWATDFSRTAVEALGALVREDAVLRGRVRVGRRDADDTDGLPVGHFDTVVVNSVAQYFPGPDHLRTVVERVLPLLAPGGSVLLGDLRNLDLARARLTGAELAGGAAGRDVEEVREAVADRAARETELLLSPALFAALARELPAVRAVDVRVRRGVHHNEPVRFRYDVVLSTAAPAADLSEVPALVWGGTVTGTDDIEKVLDADRPAALRLSGVPNRRVYGAYRAMRLLDEPGAGVAGVAEAVAALDEAGPAPDPEEWCAAGERLGYRALPTWSPGAPDSLDIVYVDEAALPSDGPLTGVFVSSPVPDGPVANVPVAFDRAVALDVVLRGYLRQRLPDGLVPAALVVHRELPLDGDGLVDRAALSAPRPEAAGPGTPPGTPLQEIVRDLFAEVLGLPRRLIDADCDFFRVGGHSLAAVRLLGRLRETLGTGPGSPAALREAPTPAALAALLSEAPAAAIGPGTAGTDSVVLALRLRGALDVRVLDETLAVLGRRHEVLRNSRVGTAGTRLRSLAPDDHLLELALPATDVDLWSQLPLAAELARVHRTLAGGDVPAASRELVRYAPRSPYGDAALTQLPGSGPRAFDTAPGRLELDLDEALHARLTRFAAAQGATVFMVVHAAVTALLGRLGTAGGITVAAPVPARDNEGLRGAVGAYGRVLALTVDASGDPAFSELVRRAREQDVAAYRSGGAPLAGTGGVALTVLQETVGQFAAGGVTVLPQRPGLPLPATDVGFTLTERQTPEGAPAGIALTTTYRHETVGETVAATLTGQLTALLAAALDRPETVLSELLPDGRSKAWDGVWESSRHVLPAATVAELFEARVRRAPKAPALSGMDYAELDSRSDLLAHALVAHGAGPGATVLTALSSPTAFAVAALAVVKTGAACLPADPGQKLPGSVRPVALLLDETADLLLPQVPGAARLVRDEAADLLPSDGRWPLRDADRTRPLSAGDPVLWALGEDGATVVGSGPVVAATLAEPVDAAWLVRGYPDADAAIGLLGALVRGVQVHVPDLSLRHAVPQEILRWLRDRDARALLGGSDEVLVALVALAREEGMSLITSGGWAEGHLVVEHRSTGVARPAPGYRAYVLDAQLRPVASGGVGALYVAGAGVALGYAGAPAATGERFLPDPFDTTSGATARMWRTGRAARMGADGSLTVLEGPAPDDPFADALATFVVAGDAAGRRALWPASAPVPEGWSEIHAEGRYELCLDHLDEGR
ncbi:AMP-binding protein [Streptomyces sp. ITFR-16]|uniref:AMP-binding protein n=1 Tax=Streptomyces sp. ITFR-16 TaxID=3075198 RepID=UPI002889D875|nr:AMP-binding protein [Streptomyces sp. ITFR-16]WNI27169.1 AMP-binding protein [Streptomyces sp. ITFR-16]